MRLYVQGKSWENHTFNQKHIPASVFKQADQLRDDLHACRSRQLVLAGMHG